MFNVQRADFYEILRRFHPNHLMISLKTNDDFAEIVIRFH